MFDDRNGNDQWLQSGILSPDLRPRDRSLGPGREPPLGAHIMTQRRWYTHHGIYVGTGKSYNMAGSPGVCVEIVLTNNCEHFCEQCVRGEHRSYQVDERAAGYQGRCSD